MTATPNLNQLEIMTEAELEAIVHKEPGSKLADDARYTLGRLSIEGSFPDRVPRNEKKGLFWIKEAVSHDHLPALEYKTYYDIRFEKHPSIKKIVESLEKIVKINKSTRACATLAEFCAAQPTIEGNKERAAHFYAMAAEQNCVIGLHWMGVYYMEGHGVAMNLDKSEALLLKAHKMGNAQSAF